MKKMVFGAFILLMAAQWYFAMDIVRSHQQIHRYGEEVTFRINPFWLQGTHQNDVIHVTLAHNQITVSDTGLFESGMSVFVRFEPDESGILVPIDVSKKRPEHGLYLKTKLTYVDTGTSSVTVTFPQLSYVLPKHEVEFWDIPITEPFLEGQWVFLAEAKLFKGDVVITNITIDGIPVIEYFGVKDETDRLYRK